jgi:hypothetical protein
MEEYKAQWTEFEVQSLAFGILRKSLYPHFLVRGEYKFPGCRPDITIWKAHKEREPELVLILEVKKSPNGSYEGQKVRYEGIRDVPCLYIRGQNEAYKVMSLVGEYLYK